MMNLKKFEEITLAKEIYDMAQKDLEAISAYKPVAQKEFELVLGHRASSMADAVVRNPKLATDMKHYRFQSAVMAVDEQDELKVVLVAIFSKRVAKAIQLLKSLGVDVEEAA